MVTLTRLDCALASSGMMRASLAEAVHHTRGRSVFGKMLVSQPIMTRVLADMALDVAAATALSFRLAEAFDKARDNAEDAAYARVMTPVAKYWCCKIAPALIYEAMECIGGSGYVEERPIARHYREAPVNAIWEGSGNVMALDVLRVLTRGKDLFETVFRRSCAAISARPARRPIDVLRAAMALCERDEGAAPPAGRTAGARCRCCRTLSARAQGASPMPSSKPASPAAGARPTACSIPASMPPISSTCSIRRRHRPVTVMTAGMLKNEATTVCRVARRHRGRRRHRSVWRAGSRSWPSARGAQCAGARGRRHGRR